METMKSWRITNQRAGVDLGTYHAEDEAGALEALARDAGHDSYADMCEVAPVAEGELRVVEVKPARAAFGLEVVERRGELVKATDHDEAYIWVPADALDEEVSADPYEIDQAFARWCREWEVEPAAEESR